MSTKLKLNLAEKLHALAPLLEYPREDFGSRLEAALAAVEDNSQEFALLKDFETATKSLEAHQLEEIYTRTFDLAPICIPYISSYVYGDENFERGALMTGLQQRYNDCAFDTKGELPDHLALILRFAPNFSEEEMDELLDFCVLNALDKMCESMKDADNLYYSVLRTTQVVIESGRRGRLS